MRFEFATATRIVFGAGAVRDLAPAARELGKRPLVVTGRSRERTSQVLEKLRDAGLAATTLDVDGEPSVQLVESGVALARRESCDMVISFGGGSTIDAGKASDVFNIGTGQGASVFEVLSTARRISGREIPAEIESRSLYAHESVQQSYKAGRDRSAVYEFARPVFENGVKAGTVRLGLRPARVDEYRARMAAVRRPAG